MTTILVADDNRSIREYCRRELEDDGYYVLLARDGAEACYRVRCDRPDAAILDILMPAMDGLAALEQIRSFDPEMPVIFFTACDDACLTDRRSRLATACVEKSEDLSELKRVVHAALTARRRRQPYRLGLAPAGAEE
jgi:CheY-like chemotaxis protein